jgi:amidophosphoribosyltransferase
MPFSFDAGSNDHPREECGMFRVIGDLAALSICYRREEGTDIVALDIGGKLNTYTVMDLGLIKDVFHDPAPLVKLPRNKKDQTYS